MRVWTVRDGETFEGYDTRWLYCGDERVADLGLPVSDLAPFVVDACNAAERNGAAADHINETFNASVAGWEKAPLTHDERDEPTARIRQTATPLSESRFNIHIEGIATPGVDNE